MKLEEKAKLLLKQNYNDEFITKVRKIYMDHNLKAYGGRVIPLDVAIELAAFELGIISVRSDRS
tara:strand:+ start:1293 stop:1484 length:192 start_codon:yes stop_codon:yes gene_type:complete